MTIIISSVSEFIRSRINMVLSMDRWVGKVAVVTGASAGIGAAIAERLVEKGVKVAAFARRKERLEELAKKLSGQSGKLYPVQVDLSNEEDIIKGFKWVKDNLGPVHILINNAGSVGGSTNLHNGDTQIWKTIFQLNVIGLCVATREAIKDMKANNIDGHIIHINSVLGHYVLPVVGMSAYPASKFAVTALAETLRLELNSLKLKIKITSLSPGPVNTEFHPKPIVESEAFKEILAEKQILDPENVVAATIYVLSTPPHVQIQELTIRSVMSPSNEKGETK